MAPTKKILCMSMFELLETHALDAIATKTIYERVGISAHSFYYHFKDKFDCTCYLFRVILFRAMGGRFSNPDDLLRDIADEQPMNREMEKLRRDAPSDDVPAYHLWIKKYNDMWYSMATYVRNHARNPFIHLYLSREANSPYEELQAAWNRYFEHIGQSAQIRSAKQRDFMKEALFSFWELYMFHFALNMEYDFQRSDAELLMHIRQSLYNICLTHAAQTAGPTA